MARTGSDVRGPFAPHPIWTEFQRIDGAILLAFIGCRPQLAALGGTPSHLHRKLRQAVAKAARMRSNIDLVGGYSLEPGSRGRIR